MLAEAAELTRGNMTEQRHRQPARGGQMRTRTTRTRRQYVSEDALSAVVNALRFPKDARYTEQELRVKTGFSLQTVNFARRELERRGIIECAGVRPSQGGPREWRVKR